MGSACSDVHMALCAVNLAECAEEKIPPSTLVEIHLTAALGLKTRCGGKLGFLAVTQDVGHLFVGHLDGLLAVWVVSSVKALVKSFPCFGFGESVFLRI